MRKSLRGKSLRNSRRHDDFNPIEGAVNIIDVMLVFACGLMLSLITNWNVDFSVKQVDLSQGKEVSQVESLQKSAEGAQDPQSAYQKMGVLYRDPVSGKMYMYAEDGTQQNPIDK